MERKIVEVLSHNVVFAKLPSGNNSIVFGKGIGFKKEPGEMIPSHSITQEFLLHTPEGIEQYNQVVEMVHFPIIAATEEVIAMAIQKLSGSFSDTIHAALIDHINFAIERYKKGIYLRNPFTFEIRHLYPEEYSIAEQSVQYLNERLQLDLPEEEIAFLATHFHSARAFKKNTDPLTIARIASHVFEKLQLEDLKLEHNFSAIRLLSHIKALIGRVKTCKTINNPLLVNIREQYPDGFNRARKIGVVLEEQLGQPVPDEEIGFLTLHLERLQIELSTR